jgi:hypothetical protein
MMKSWWEARCRRPATLLLIIIINNNNNNNNKCAQHDRYAHHEDRSWARSCLADEYDDIDDEATSVWAIIYIIKYCIIVSIKKGQIFGWKVKEEECINLFQLLAYFAAVSHHLATVVRINTSQQKCGQESFPFLRDSTPSISTSLLTYYNHVPSRSSRRFSTSTLPLLYDLFLFLFFWKQPAGTCTQPLFVTAQERPHTARTSARTLTITITITLLKQVALLLDRSATKGSVLGEMQRFRHIFLFVDSHELVV